MSLPKKPYFWAYTIDCDRGDGRGITEMSQGAAAFDPDYPNVGPATTIGQALTEAFHYAALGYDSVQVSVEAWCAKCGGGGDISVKMVRIVGRRKQCPDCRGKGHYADTHIGPIPLKPGEAQKIVEREQVILIEAPITKEEWGFELDKGAEIIIRGEPHCEEWVVRSWPKLQCHGKITDAQLTVVRNRMILTYFYR